MNKILLALLLGGAALAAHAGGEARLKQFVSHVHAAQADFTQEVQDEKGRLIQSAAGVMQFSRPGKFRWEYHKPYAQILVGDGKRFWLYDVELNQVTVRKLDASLGSSPAALLSGSRAIMREFTLRDLRCETQYAKAGPASAPRATAPHAASAPHDTAAFSCPLGEEKLAWLEATPRLHDTSFDRIRMAFNAKSELVVMELRDALGHTTVLHFYNMRINPHLRPDLFQFKPPADADVLSDQ